LTYTWSTTGTPPAPVSFSANGTNAAQTVTATFTKAGSYSFQVTVSDPAGYIATSSVTVTVNQTATAINVTPATANVPASGQQQFTGSAVDQFGTAMGTQPSLTWSVSSGSGTINSSTGLYQAPAAAGSATVKATGGGVSGTASVTIQAPPTTSTTVTYTLVSSWNNGFQAGITITNTGNTTINGWTLQFDFQATITQIWNATISSHTGNHYTLKYAGYNSTITPGQSVSIGFLGTPGGVPVPPTNFQVNGQTSNTPPPPGNGVSAKVAFTDVNDWGTGFTGNLTITNTGTSSINGWTLEFDFVGTIGDIWNASIVSHVGNHFVIKDVGYNSTIAAGQSVTFGFNASPGKPTPPTNYTLNGVPIS
jgi:hypothetical protein